MGGSLFGTLLLRFSFQTEAACEAWVGLGPRLLLDSHCSRLLCFACLCLDRGAVVSRLSAQLRSCSGCVRSGLNTLQLVSGATLFTSLKLVLICKQQVAIIVSLYRCENKSYSKKAPSYLSVVRWLIFHSFCFETVTLCSPGCPGAYCVE